MIGTLRTWKTLAAGLIVALILAGSVGLAQIAFYKKIALGTTPCMLSAGAGTPEGAVTGSPCDLFLRTNGAAGTTLYVKETGAATNTGWGPATTATATVTVGSGGTGLTSYTIGDLIQASAATTLAKLAAVAAGSYLRSGGVGVVSVWSTLILPNAAAQGELPTATAANTYTNLAVGAAGQYLRSGGAAANVTWGSFGWGELYSDNAGAAPFVLALDADTGTFEVLTHADIKAGDGGGLMTVSAAADTIDATGTGVFSIRFGVSARGNAAGTDAISFKAYKEGVALSDCQLSMDMIDATSYTRGAVVCIVTAVANDTFDFRVNNETDGTDIEISVLNFSMIKVGG